MRKGIFWSLICGKRQSKRYAFILKEHDTLYRIYIIHCIYKKVFKKLVTRHKAV